MIWASDYSRAFALAATVERCGVGLHSGQDCLVRLEVATRDWTGDYRFNVGVGFKF